jgi:hypothetical protein
VLKKRESDTRFFTSGFFLGSVSPGPLSIVPLETFQIFTNIFSRRFSKVKVIPMGVQYGALILYFFGISIGIKRKMIDIGKKITFNFLQNV